MKNEILVKKNSCAQCPFRIITPINDKEGKDGVWEIICVYYDNSEVNLSRRINTFKMSDYDPNSEELFHTPSWCKLKEINIRKEQ